MKVDELSENQMDGRDPFLWVCDCGHTNSAVLMHLGSSICGGCGVVVRFAATQV